ncbi:tripartite tricarboxylate transporter substrate binding protein [Rhodospirillales bacterium]|jgi:tripartite-type tricarboxylate transporter receptor subunit TctC|nr:tripartite tricarboxylate transporter substrate binding protein [Rhodospirillales bacterium]HBS38869.1 tripartite tricarboxylate transporter substrate binding protein [Paracoccaceae bacterium]
MTLSKKFTNSVVAGAALAVLSSTAYAADYPSKPITLVAPYSAGGASDMASRTMASVLPSYLNQPVLVVNRTGAGGVTGSTFVNKAKPDGYTLLLARIGSQSVSPAMKANIPYKYDDFTMLAVIELNPVICATASSKPYKTMKDLIDAVKAKPGELSFSSAGVGSMLHVAVPLVLSLMDVKNPKDAMNHIPYKGGGAAATAAVGGHVDLVCTNSSALTSHIAGGKLRPLMITTKERQAVAKDAPTARELGFPQIEVLVGWSGIYGPPGMDPAVAKKIRDALQLVKKDKAWNKFTKALGSVPHILDEAETKKFVDDQFTAFNTLVSDLGMKIE